MKVHEEEALSANDIDLLQEQAWSETYRYVFQHSPFYQRHFAAAGLTPTTPLPLRRLACLPPIDKTVLSEHTEAFRCVGSRQMVDVVTTSGSTGKPLIWMLTESDLERLAWNEFLSFRCVGLSAADTVLLGVALDRCFIAGMAYYLGLRKLGCTILRVGPTTPMMHLDLLQRLGANAIVTVPSSLCLLADKAAEAGLEPASLGLRQAICIGEPVRQADLSLTRAGRLIQERWRARVFSTYGITELAASLCECEAGCGGHLHPELLYVETLDEAGRPVPDGEIGELTATTFGVEGMPLVRYRTGDYAALYRGVCPCGRRTLRLGPIVGRKHHKLKLKGTTVFPSTLKAVLDATPEVLAYVIMARRAEALCDAVEVRAACAADPAVVFRALRERFQGEAKVIPELTAATPEEIEALQMPDGARKRRYFVDLRHN